MPGLLLAQAHAAQFKPTAHAAEGMSGAVPALVKEVRAAEQLKAPRAQALHPCSTAWLQVHADILVVQAPAARVLPAVHTELLRSAKCAVLLWRAKPVAFG